MHEATRLEAARQGAARILQAGRIELAPDIQQRAMTQICSIALELVQQETVTTFRSAAGVQTDRIARPTKHLNDKTGGVARGRMPDRVGDQIIDKLGWFWFDYTGEAPTISCVRGSRKQPAPRYTGPFLGLVQSFCSELYEDLAAHPELNVTDDLVNSVKQLRTNGRKAYDRLRQLRKDGRLPPSSCTRCGGTGFEGEQPCPDCNFDGAIEKKPAS
jgi:hypothetical protein